MTFKAGDRVRLTAPIDFTTSAAPPTTGKTYVVRDVLGNYLLLEGVMGQWSVKRFVPWCNGAQIVQEAEADNPNKLYPVVRGLLDYFPDACLEVANCSLVANEQHNPGEPLHWAKEKSQDEADACVRHMMKRGTRDSDKIRHSAKAAWRALANLQREIEAESAQ